MGEVVADGDVILDADSLDFLLEAPKQPKLSPTLLPIPPIIAAARDDEEGDNELF